jgi:retron-type reverse transcriptase
LHEELNEQTYCHGEYEPFNISDPKPRQIHKATVRDRLVHHVLFRVFYPIFDASFIHDSYSCRIGKGTHRAVKCLKLFLQKASGNNSRNIYALKCDVKRFFDSVNHGILLLLIRRKISDAGTLWLVELILNSFYKEPSIGLPLGNVTSQLFANIYLNELDRFVKHRLHARYYLRYCDDFVLLLDDTLKAEELIGELNNFLQCRLCLLLHPDKISLRTYRQGVDFVGYVVRPYCTTLRTKTKRRMFKRISQKNQASYFGLLKHCNGFAIKKKLLGITPLERI